MLFRQKTQPYQAELNYFHGLTSLIAGNSTAIAKYQKRVLLLAYLP